MPDAIVRIDAGMADGRVSRDPVPIGESLDSVVRSLRDESPRLAAAAGGPTAWPMGGVFGRWDEAVGDAVAAHVQPVRLDGDQLVVEVDDPAWATQLRFLEADVEQRLAAKLPAPRSTRSRSGCACLRRPSANRRLRHPPTDRRRNASMPSCVTPLR